MIILFALIAVTPIILSVIGSFIMDVSFYTFVDDYGKIWVFVSPIWTILIAGIAYWYGKTIEVLETAKFAVNTVQENKHHAVNAFNFIKKKVKK